MSYTISVATRELAESTIHLVIGSLAGKLNAFPDLVEGVYVSVAWQFLSDVQESFVMKARSEVGVDGIRWKYLSREYLAYGRRFGSNEQSQLKRAAGLVTTDKNGKASTAQFRFAPGGKKGLLTAAQLKQWRKFYAFMLARMLAGGRDEGEAKRIAAGYAWNQMKARGAETKLNVYGSRQVEMLRDTNVMFNSLSPMGSAIGEYVDTIGQLAGVAKNDQILQTIRGGVRVGTTVPYAASHHYGDGRRGIPARPFWPEELPPQWRDNMTDVLKEATKFATIRALERVSA